VLCVQSRVTGGGFFSPPFAAGFSLANHDAAARWLQEQRDRDDRRDVVRFWGMLVLTFIAAVASSIAAWPIIKEWLG
jgi:hypothetical protein